jgi:hypothetical protein
MAFIYKQLREMSDQELIEFHDQMAPPTSVGVAYALDELARRTTERQTARLLDYTNQIRWFTIAVMIFTAVNVVLFVLD